MPVSLRLILLAGALLIFATVLSNIRKKKILMNDSTGWVCIAAGLLVIAIYPRIVTWMSGKLGFQSPANFVFLIVIGLLTIKTFRDSARISLLRHKIEELAQEAALAQADDEGGEKF